MSDERTLRQEHVATTARPEHSDAGGRGHAAYLRFLLGGWLVLSGACGPSSIEEETRRYCGGLANGLESLGRRGAAPVRPEPGWSEIYERFVYCLAVREATEEQADALRLAFAMGIERAVGMRAESAGWSETLGDLARLAREVRDLPFR